MSLITRWNHRKVYDWNEVIFQRQQEGEEYDMCITLEHEDRLYERKVHDDFVMFASDWLTQFDGPTRRVSTTVTLSAVRRANTDRWVTTGSESSSWTAMWNRTCWTAGSSTFTPGRPLLSLAEL
ncbi:hypothetical protein LTS18_008860 [Coniosporium uncinatum]|uniref:Uncharacterized protein n=1 Tax=Coniosporium uncinatum TaxID=93489 RepID=A0ACC3DMN1_9PEZI|nr:hypothetical protein LTS18_008860 [Coniosporium uncinatum]